VPYYPWQKCISTWQAKRLGKRDTNFCFVLGRIINLNLIYKDQCLFVCMELVQIHISEPIWTKLCTHLPLGLEEVVGYVWTHNISTFPPFRPILSGARADSWAEDGCWRQSRPLLRYIRDAARVGVTSREWRALCVMQRKRGEVKGMHVCGNGNLMRREGSK